MDGTKGTGGGRWNPGGNPRDSGLGRLGKNRKAETLGKIRGESRSPGTEKESYCGEGPIYKRK